MTRIAQKVDNCPPFLLKIYWKMTNKSMLQNGHDFA